MDTIRLVAVGDICLGDHYFTLGHGTGSRITHGLDPFSDISTFFKDADIVIGNLEGPLASSSGNEYGPEALAFRGPPQAAGLLRRTGFNFLHIANNHILQHGERAFYECLNALTDEGIQPVGIAGDSLAARPAIFNNANTSVALLGYSIVPEQYVPDQSLYAMPAFPDIIADVREMRHKVHNVVVSVHWGHEGTFLPTHRTVQAARAIIDAGATLVLGHHPHYFQPVERYKGGLIAYSLGDFVFDLFWDRNLVESAILQVSFSQAAVTVHSILPVCFQRNSRVRKMSQRASGRFLRKLERRGQTVFNATNNRERQQGTFSRVVAQGRKSGFFFANFLRGDTHHKKAFIWKKIAAILRTYIGIFS